LGRDEWQGYSAQSFKNGSAAVACKKAFGLPRLRTEIKLPAKSRSLPMSKRANLLDQINVASPCSADWDSMIGNEQARFCQHCSLFVHDLSNITRKDAVKLVASSKGKLCVRYYRHQDGVVHTSTHAQPLTQIKRRLSRIAAGAFTATLSLASSVAAQSAQSISRNVPSVIEAARAKDIIRQNNLDGQTATLVGTVFDLTKAVIAEAEITLINEKTGQEQSIKSADDGTFRFQTVEAGNYKLKIEAPGFVSYQREKIALRPGAEERLDATLDVGSVMGGAVMIVADTPLVNAIWRIDDDDDLTEVKHLLAVGVDVNLVDESAHTTALDEAVASGKLELVQMLLSAGADANVRNSSGQTALMRLDESSSAEIVSVLVYAGAKVNLKDEDGDSALLVAAALEKTEILKALLDAGAKVNTQNKEGKTALMIAAEDGSVENVRALLEAGANVNKKNKEGATALKYAKENEHAGVIEVLSLYGAFE
jgi:hypothetical protein